MWILKKIFFKITLLFLILLVIFCFCLFSYNQNGRPSFKSNETNEFIKAPLKNYNHFNLWFIFTKVEKNNALQYKFNNLIKSLIEHTSNKLHFNIICDEYSKNIASKILDEQSNSTRIEILYSFYDVDESAKRINDIVETMTPHFSSRPGE